MLYLKKKFRHFIEGDGAFFLVEIFSFFFLLWGLRPRPWVDPRLLNRVLKLECSVSYKFFFFFF